MEKPSKRMRLTVVVKALVAENAHGEYQAEALAAFKERKFALPVELHDTFETVWGDIEQRYKKNYLNAQQAATFSIKKLQDAYDCDLDMTDTVGDIFEGEPDVKMRMINVVPHFIYRETSVVPGSMLRPTGAQKRGGEDVDDGANKRRRVAAQRPQSASETRDLSPNRPIPSTESQQAAVAGTEDAEAGRHLARSRTGASLVELGRTETGQAPFSAPTVKQEEPEPEQPPLLDGIEAASPNEPAEPAERPVKPAIEERPGNERPSRRPTRTPRAQPQEAPPQPTTTNEEVAEVDHETAGDEQADAQAQAGPSQVDPQEVAMQQSPVSSVEPEPKLAPATGRRKDVYDVSSSPDFMHPTATPDKTGVTYGRPPGSSFRLLNTARGYGRSAGNRTPASAAKAHAVQPPLADVIGSTPHEEAQSATRPKSYTAANDEDNDDADPTVSLPDEAAAPTSNTHQTPARKTPAKSSKPGSLKKPSRDFLVSTPTSTKGGANSQAAATPASLANASKPRPAIRPSPMQLASSTKKQRSISSAASQSAIGSPKGKEAAVVTKRATKTPTPNSTQTVTGTPQEKPHECLTCHARFVRESNLKRHAKTHADERTHTCSNCGRNFSRVDALARHSRLHEGCPGLQSSVDFEGMEDDQAETLGRTHERSNSVRSLRNKITSYLDHNTETDTGRNEVLLLPNGRHALRSRSAGSSLLATGDPSTSKNSPDATVKASAKMKSATQSSTPKFDKNTTKQPAVTTHTAKPANGTTEISSAESSSSDSSDSSDSDPDPDDEPEQQAKTGTEVGLEVQGTPAKRRSQRITDDRSSANDKEKERPKTLPEHETPAMYIAAPQTQDKPPSGQEAEGAARWGTRNGCGLSDQSLHTPVIEPTQDQKPAPEAAVVTPVTDDEGFADQDHYSTAFEDNAAGSRSASVAVSTRSSPAVSRRPARFLSHSPTPDASESDDGGDEATALKVASPRVNNQEESESESESSSDSEDDETPALPTGPASGFHTQAEPPSSPPLGGLVTLAPIVSKSSQSAPSQARPPTQQTPVPLPTLQSPQAPRSSQSVSVQAADRRRYTGFRSLREQLADTKAAQATTQKKTFDPRTMSLGKLTKGMPLAALGSDVESSDDESSSDSDSD